MYHHLAPIIGTVFYLHWPKSIKMNSTFLNIFAGEDYMSVRNYVLYF